MKFINFLLILIITRYKVKSIISFSLAYNEENKFMNINNINRHSKFLPLRILGSNNNDKKENITIKLNPNIPIIPNHPALFHSLHPEKLSVII